MELSNVIDKHAVIRKVTGERIRRLRVYLKKTQRQFAGELDVSASMISQIETGKRYPPDYFADRLYRLYGVNPMWVRRGCGTMFEVEYILQMNTASYIDEGTPHGFQLSYNSARVS